MTDQNNNDSTDDPKIPIEEREITEWTLEDLNDLDNLIDRKVQQSNHELRLAAYGCGLNFPSNNFDIVPSSYTGVIGIKDQLVNILQVASRGMERELRQNQRLWTSNADPNSIKQRLQRGEQLSKTNSTLLNETLNFVKSYDPQKPVRFFNKFSSEI